MARAEDPGTLRSTLPDIESLQEIDASKLPDKKALKETDVKDVNLKGVNEIASKFDAEDIDLNSEDKKLESIIKSLEQINPLTITDIAFQLSEVNSTDLSDKGLDVYTRLTKYIGFN